MALILCYRLTDAAKKVSTGNAIVNAVSFSARAALLKLGLHEVRMQAYTLHPHCCEGIDCKRAS